MDPVIQVQHVSKCFRIAPHKSRTLQAIVISRRGAHRLEDGTVWALRDVSLSVRKGETVGVVGPNGSGKSTLLKILAGVLQPSEGNVMVREPSFALLELGAGFRLDLTGEENLRMYGALFGLNREEARNCLQTATEFAELGRFIQMPVRSYSSGMRARLAMAAAVSINAPVILIDEVLAVGDAAFREKSLKRLAGLRRAGHTILIVSHDLENLQRLCDRVVVLMDGSVAYEGEPQEAIWYYLQKVREQQARRLHSTLPGEEIGEERERPPIEILGAETLDERERPKQVFGSGDTLLLRVKYCTHETIDNPVFQVQLWAHPVWNKEPVIILGTNSERMRYRVQRAMGEGALTVRYEHIPLLSGEYSFRVAVFSYLFASSPLDLCSDLAVFRVESRWDEGGGLIKIPHTWADG